MNGIFLLLGSNLDERLKNLETARRNLATMGVKATGHSSLYETEPWGEKDQPWFLNVVLQVETALDPDDLLQACLAVERQMGRERETKWGPRLIDIDLLYYKDQIIEKENLIVPHPGIPDRKFTLLPLVELAGGMVHPGFNKTQIELLMECDDQLEVKKTKLAFA